MKPTAAWIAPSTVRDPSDTTTTTHTKPSCATKFGVVVRRLLVHREQAAAEAGDAGRERERDDPRPGRVDADRRGRDLAAAQRVEERGRSCRRAPDHDERPDDREDDEQSTRNDFSLREVDRADAAAAASSIGVMPLPPLDPVELHHHAVEEQRERERRERQEDAAEPQRREREQRADRGRDAAAPRSIADEHRHAELVRELRGRERADAGERRLAQRDLARHAGDHGDRQEDDREDHGVLRADRSRRRWRGRRASRRSRAPTTTPKTRVISVSESLRSTRHERRRRRVDAGERVGRPPAGCAARARRPARGTARRTAATAAGSSRGCCSVGR